VLHRAPGATTWEEWDLERAMDRVAELVKKTRDETFIERLPNGKLVDMTPAIFSLGGATLDAESTVAVRDPSLRSAFHLR
jgi:formate dehydrogenase major subunit